MVSEGHKITEGIEPSESSGELTREEKKDKGIELN